MSARTLAIGRLRMITPFPPTTHAGVLSVVPHRQPPAACSDQDAVAANPASAVESEQTAGAVRIRHLPRQHHNFLSLPLPSGGGMSQRVAVTPLGIHSQRRDERVTTTTVAREVPVQMRFRREARRMAQAILLWHGTAELDACVRWRREKNVTGRIVKVEANKTKRGHVSGYWISVADTEGNVYGDFARNWERIS